MKRYNYIIIIFCMFMLLGFTANTYATNSTNLTDWNAQKDIRLSGDGEYKYIWLDEDVYRHAKQNLNDVRIKDAKGNFVPHFIENIYTEIEGTTELFNLNLVDTKKMKDKESFDFEVKTNDINKDVTINYMDLNIGGQDYVKEVDIYGSYDGLLWEYIAKDKVYNIENINKTNIYFNDVKKYKFYRFEVPNNIENIKINSIMGYKNDSNVYTNKYYKQKEIQTSTENKDNSTYIYINNADRLHIHKIKLETDDTFRRNYEVRLDGGEYSEYSGEIYNLNLKNVKAENTEISFPNETSDKDIVIKINNGDDSQIDISKVNITYSIDRVIFKAENDSAYKLIYGNENASKPTYDIEKYKTYVVNEEMDECTLGELILKEVSQGEVKKDNTQLYKIIFNALMVVISIGLVVYIGIKLRKK
ncbi:MAG TPA: hypothetical protein DEP72_02420 [Clostridiales bacterium]|nr:MAG: hypothetical protein A2Y18_01355 [Clostridiales bacterium GWD2_32_19]HCC07011.1 hypothetical protein [Clostridiales bacterium]